MNKIWQFMTSTRLPSLFAQLVTWLLLSFFAAYLLVIIVASEFGLAIRGSFLTGIIFAEFLFLGMASAFSNYVLRRENEVRFSVAALIICVGTITPAGVSTLQVLDGLVSGRAVHEHSSSLGGHVVCYVSGLSACGPLLLTSYLAVFLFSTLLLVLVGQVLRKSISKSTYTPPLAGAVVVASAALYGLYQIFFHSWSGELVSTLENDAAVFELTGELRRQGSSSLSGAGPFLSLGAIIFLVAGMPILVVRLAGSITHQLLNSNGYRSFFRRLLSIFVGVLETLAVLVLQIVACAVALWFLLSLVFIFATGFGSAEPPIWALGVLAIGAFGSGKDVYTGLMIAWAVFKGLLLVCGIVLGITLISWLIIIIYRSVRGRLGWRLAGLVSSFFIVGILAVLGLGVERFTNNQEPARVEVGEIPPDVVDGDVGQADMNLEVEIEEPKWLVLEAGIECTGNSGHGTSIWSLASDNFVELPVWSCELTGAEGANAIVVIGLASRVGQTSVESDRSFSRGWRMATAISRKLPNDVEIYVLSLGKKSAPSFRFLDRFTTRYPQDRPLLAYKAFKSDPSVELSAYDMTRSVVQTLQSRGFTQQYSECIYYRFDRRKRLDTDLRQSQFVYDCGFLIEE